MEDAPAPTVRQTDILDPARARALEVVLGRSACLEAGAPLPPFFHQVYFWDVRPEKELGRDGHPRPGLGLIPETGLPRRMWAAGELECPRQLLLGEPAEKVSRRVDVQRKSGRLGPMVFVTLEHVIAQKGQTCVIERQKLVYLNDRVTGAPDVPPPRAEGEPAAARSVTFSTTTLFRYSALTFNGHRIHYDLDYAREVEGYPGLVVHGPLLAQHLALLAERRLGRLRRFAFRARAPLFHFESAALEVTDKEFRVVAGDGRLCMTATAEGGN